jgi:hypothetical protein
MFVFGDLYCMALLERAGLVFSGPHPTPLLKERELED